MRVVDKFPHEWRGILRGDMMRDEVTPDVGPSVLEIERWEMVRWKMEKVEDGTGGTRRIL